MIGRGVSIIIRRYVARPPSRDDGPLFTFLFPSIYALALINFVAFKERERENFSQCPCIMHNKWERERERKEKILQWLSSGHWTVRWRYVFRIGNEPLVRHLRSRVCACGARFLLFGFVQFFLTFACPLSLSSSY